MKIGTRNHPDVGRRVEIPAYADMWMRGARFGTIERVIDRSALRLLDPRECAPIYRVRLDHPQASSKLRGFHGPDCRILKGDA
jgi:hypothetical protein